MANWIKKSLKEEKTFLAGDHTLIREVLQPARDGYSEAFSLAYAELEPGTSSVPHRLKGSAEVYIIISGKGEVVIDDDIIAVETGDTVFIPADALQFAKCVGEQKLGFYCVVSPAWSKENEEILSSGQ